MSHASKLEKERRVRRHIVFMVIATTAIFAPIGYWVGDRTPPFTRLHGEMLPKVVERGGVVRVKYWTTKRVKPDESCPGTVQQEITDSSGTIYSKRVRQTGPAHWEVDPRNPSQEIFTGHPVQLPAELAPGEASFRSTTFRHCNWFTRHVMPWWPIVQVGPDIGFEITCQHGWVEEGKTCLPPSALRQ